MNIFLKNKKMFVWAGVLFLFVFFLSPEMALTEGPSDPLPSDPFPSAPLPGAPGPSSPSTGTGSEPNVGGGTTGGTGGGGVGSYVPLSEIPGVSESNVSPESYIKNWVQLGIGLAAVFAVIMIVVGGVQYVISSAFDSKSDAKKRIWAAIGGFILALGAYLILFTINPDLLNIRLPKNLGSDVEKTFSPFLDGGIDTAAASLPPLDPFASVNCAPNCKIATSGSIAYECRQEGVNYKPVQVSTAPSGESVVSDIAGGGSALSAGACVGFIANQACANVTPPCQFEEWQYAYDFQAGIDHQIETASAPLQELLSCMGNTLPAGVGQISSISHSSIASGAHTYTECTTTSGLCAHGDGSCHFGGAASSQCFGSGSYAVDFGDEGNANSIISAAASCEDSGAKFIYEGNHVHISVGEQEGCGCK